MVVLVDRVKFATATTGTGSISIGATASGFQSVSASGVADGDTVRYTIEDGSNWEIGSGVYDSAAQTITRAVSSSSNAGSAISLSGLASVFLTAAAEDIVQPSEVLNDGYLLVKSSATAPTSPVYGQLWADTVNNEIKAWDGSAWQNLSNKIYGVGGTEVEYSLSGVDYRAHIFQSSGTFTALGSSGTVDVLIVAGGGGGGGSEGSGASGAGGGAGGVIYSASLEISPGQFSVVVGGGGAGTGAVNDSPGSDGGDSSAFNLTAIGGGGGGGRDANNIDSIGRDGGSGGGEGSQGTTSASYPGSGTSGQGYDGGFNGVINENISAENGSGGGGGAGGVGENGLDNSYGGDGGVGAYYGDKFPTAYLFDSGYIAGGGGSGRAGSLSGTQGSGGLGGGADGGNTNASNAPSNSGGGGGGAGASGSASNGGSGVVMIRYRI